MMELLKRFEEEAAEDETALLEDSDDDLASRLESMDLGILHSHPESGAKTLLYGIYRQCIV